MSVSVSPETFFMLCVLGSFFGYVLGDFFFGVLGFLARQLKSSLNGKRVK